MTADHNKALYLGGSDPIRRILYEPSNASRATA
jgi:hypothetical protein